MYDGHPLQILDEIDDGSLTLPLDHDSAPRIVTISGGREMLSRDEQDHDAMAVADERFLQPLRVLSRTAVSPAARPDFLLLTMHWSIVHDRVFGRFMAAVQSLLVAGYSVHVNRFTVAGDGQRGTRDIVSLLAAPAGTDPAWWQDSLSDLALANPWAERSSIDDLAFQNTRSADPFDGSLVCQPPRPKEADTPAATTVYNHRTDIVITDPSGCSPAAEAVDRSQHPMYNDGQSPFSLKRGC